jgi:hypothetical protein
MDWIERAAWVIAVVVVAYNAYNFGWIAGFKEGADL